ncbi:MAG: hypothetical protein H6719_22005 [Sandaracinaceae bacterium]|nr:hypothetical protein [Sandaracinaceae bacterium]
MSRGRQHRPVAPRSLLVGIAALVVSAVGGGAVARAQDDLSFELPGLGRTTFTLTNTTIARYRGANYDANLFDDDFGSLYERLDFALQADELRAEARVDFFAPHTVFEESRCADLPLGADDSRCYLDWDLRPERLTLRWEPRDWTIEAGDTQIVFGRGLALAFRKVDLLGVDNALRGGHVRYSGSNFRFGLHGGVANPQNIDPIDLRVIREPEDVVVGGNMAVTAPAPMSLTLGVHALRVWFENVDSNDGVSPSRYQDRAVDVAGWSVEAPALADGQLALYFEANGLRRTRLLVDEAQTETGRGVYGSAQLQLTNLTLLIEWKDYTNFLVAAETTEGSPRRIYSAAPPVEFDGPQRLRGIGNQRGGAVRMDYAFLPGPWSFSLNSALYAFNEESDHDPFDGILVTHSWATLSKRQEYGGDLNWSIDVQAGARFEVLLHDFDDRFQAGDIDRWMIHGRIDITVGSGDHSFDLVVDQRHEREIRGVDAVEFQIGGASLTYTFGVPLALSLGLRWTDFQPGVVALRGMREYNILGGDFYPSIEIRWTFDPGTYITLFAGQTPGGQLCSGGVCRDVPTFEGFQLTFVGRL